ncbi:RNA-binding protein [Cetobacterium sp. 2A]|uniref:YlmH/Sll1252 family protein n=1 Tax=Cetobacterium sp. 2A TaxID=2754723 RepID=UPI00163B753C|nr:YlmH/Sll1252 family protein [Cetobacterium sp. 2A]MBC2856528.1 RNA-binding protein [Cetobacterium sp. 2A]
MDKKSFFNIFKECDEYLLATLFEDIMLCEQIDYPIYTDTFYPPQIWSKLENNNFFSNLNFSTFGLNSNSEKKLIAIYPKHFNKEDLSPPITFFKIDGTNKFKILEHKDFLGTLMSFRIKREMLGDIVVLNNIAYCVVFQDLYDFINSNLTSIGKIPISMSEIECSEIPESRFENLTITVSSNRLDNIISSIGDLSRGDSTSIIEKGEVLINYISEKNKSKILKVGDIITVRKNGKFIFINELGENKKGKLKIALRKFI